MTDTEYEGEDPVVDDPEDDDLVIHPDAEPEDGLDVDAPEDDPTAQEDAP